MRKSKFPSVGQAFKDLFISRLATGCAFVCRDGGGWGGGIGGLVSNRGINESGIFLSNTAS